MTGPDRDNVAQSADAGQFSHAGAMFQLLDRPVSDADLAAGTELAARPAFARGAGRIGLLMFRIGDEIAALPATMLCRVTPVVRTRPIPHVSAGTMRGICNIRGELMLCADLHRLLGLPPREKKGSSLAGGPDRRCMAVIGPADNSWAFEVDAVVGIAHVDPASVRPPPVTVSFAFGSSTTGVIDIDGQQVTVLDGERILTGFMAGIS